MDPQRPYIRNQLLAYLSSKEWDAIQPFLEYVPLERAQILEETNQEINHIYFLDSGIASIMASAHGNQIEVGIVGREGTTGLPVVLGHRVASNRTMVEIPGSAWMVPADRLRIVMSEIASFRDQLLRYVHAFMTQLAQNALAIGRTRIEERLARWLLMAHDRLSTDEIPLTHEFLSAVLGVRRAGVTTALHILEGNHLIKSTRGLVIILDRAGLRQLAGASYGISEIEFRRLTGWTPNSPPT